MYHKWYIRGGVPTRPFGVLVRSSGPNFLKFLARRRNYDKSANGTSWRPVILSYVDIVAVYVIFMYCRETFRCMVRRRIHVLMGFKSYSRRRRFQFSCNFDG